MSVLSVICNIKTHLLKYEASFRMQDTTIGGLNQFMSQCTSATRKGIIHGRAPSDTLRNSGKKLKTNPGVIFEESCTLLKITHIPTNFPYYQCF